jgi:hypothetical protein
LAAGTAVVAGTAGAVRHHQDQKYANQAADQQAQYDATQQQADMQQQMAYQQQQMGAQQQQIEQMKAQQAAAAAPPAAAAPAPAGGTDLNSQLMQLAQLHSAGVLNDEEFAQAKAKLLGG